MTDCGSPRPPLAKQKILPYFSQCPAPLQRCRENRPSGPTVSGPQRIASDTIIIGEMNNQKGKSEMKTTIIIILLRKRGQA
jgi:hypothetical protein